MNPKFFAKAFLLCVFTVPNVLFAQGSAFTYQGRLNDGSAPASGLYDLQFTIYDALASGNVVGSPVPSVATPVSNGVFTVQLDFGAGVFNGSARWMEIAVETNGGGGYTTLSPRLPITSSPYAIQAANAANAGSVAATNVVGTLGVSQLPTTVVTNGASGVSISGSFSGNGAALTGLNPYSMLGISTAPSGNAFFIASYPESLLGNTYGLAYGAAASGNYLYLANGYNDGLRVFDVSNPANPLPVAQLSYPIQPQAIVLSGGYAYLANGYDGFRIIAVTNPVSPVAVGYVSENLMGSDYAYGVAVAGTNAFIANTDHGLYVVNISNPNSPSVVANLGSATVGSAWDVAAAGNYAYVSGASGFYVVNVANPAAPVVVGSILQSAMGNSTAYGLAISGSYAYVANSAGGFVIIDISNPASPVIKSRIPYPTINIPVAVSVSGNLAYVACSSGGVSIFNVANPANPLLVTKIPESSLNGGKADGVAVAYPYAYVANDSGGLAVLGASTILAGDGGGLTNLNSAYLSGQIPFSNLPPGLITNFQSSLNLTGAFTGTFIGNGSGLNSLNASQLSSGVVSTTVLPGFQGPNYDALGGGQGNSAGDQYTTVGGGQGNSTVGTWATVSGGHNNSAAGYGAVGGGSLNNASGSLSTVPGGQLNTAAGFTSFAAGNNAQANHDGTFVWADNNPSGFASTANNQFSVRAGGGVRLVTSAAGMTIDGNVSVGSTTVGTSSISVGTTSGNVYIGTNSIGIGTNNPQAPLEIRAPGGTAALRFSHNFDTKYWFVYMDIFGGGDNLIFKNKDGNYMGITYGNGVVFSASDARMKTDIAPLEPVLDRVMQLQPVSYHFTNNPAGYPKSLGLLAQDVEPLFPEVVMRHEGVMGLSYTELIPVTVKAIQDLNGKLEDRSHASDDRIQKLERDNSELKQENESLAKRLDALEKAMSDRQP